MLVACATPDPLPRPIPAPMVQPAPTQACALHDDAVANLAQRYGEAPVAGGVMAQGGLIEVFTTPSGATWTMVVVRPDGLTCMVASGEGWRNLRWKIEGSGT